jgi:aspartate/tyrosine/aromatic aminotransferase
MAATSFDASVVPQAPEDPLFGLMAAYRRDEDPKKVDLGIGAYRDNNAKPWILPVVKKASTTALELQQLLPHVQSREQTADVTLHARPTTSSATTPT